MHKPKRPPRKYLANTVTNGKSVYEMAVHERKYTITLRPKCSSFARTQRFLRCLTEDLFTCGIKNRLVLFHLRARYRFLRSEGNNSLAVKKNKLKKKVHACALIKLSPSCREIRICECLLDGFQAVGRGYGLPLTKTDKRCQKPQF